MKLMIASDLHGSALYTEQLLDAFSRESAERLLLLGDILYHGPRNPLPEGYDTMKTTALLNAFKDRVISVRGNCDAEIDQMVLAFPIFAESMLLSLGTHSIFATHGHIYHLENLPPLQPGDILLHGHTHVPACIKQGDIYYLNPGSVSIPKENTPHHSFLLLEDGIFTWKTLSGESFMVYDANKQSLIRK